MFANFACGANVVRNDCVVPADAEGVKLMWDYYRIVRGPQRLRQLVTTNYTRSILTVFLSLAMVGGALLLKQAVARATVRWRGGVARAGPDEVDLADHPAQG